jgi:hypothetical protein
MAPTAPFFVALFLCLVSGECIAGPPGGVDSLSPLALQTRPALVSDVVVSGTMLGSVGAGAYAGLQQGDWRQLGSTAGVLLVTAGVTKLTKRGGSAAPVHLGPIPRSSWGSGLLCWDGAGQAR